MPVDLRVMWGREELLCKRHAEGGDLVRINSELESPLRHRHTLTGASGEQIAHEVQGLDGDSGDIGSAIRVRIVSATSAGRAVCMMR